MLQFPEIEGAIFDLDDTLLDNGPIDRPIEWLHARSRLAAIHEAAETHGIHELRELTPEENLAAFHTATTHSSRGAVWNALYVKGLIADKDIDPEHPLYGLVVEISDRKDQLHEPILREFGIEIPGASHFIQTLALNGLSNHLALATSAIQRDIDIFLDKYQLHDMFPPERIISAEKVTKHKPDPECFDLAFRSLGLPEKSRKKVLAFEDNPRGIASAKAAGLFVCAITSRFAADSPVMLAAQPDLIANSYDEFAEKLQIPFSS